MTVRFTHSYACFVCNIEIQEQLLDDWRSYEERLEKSKQINCNVCHTLTMVPAIFNEVQRNNLDNFIKKYLIKNICFCSSDIEKIVNTRKVIHNWLKLSEKIDEYDFLTVGLMYNFNGILIWSSDKVPVSSNYFRISPVNYREKNIIMTDPRIWSSEISLN